ncbi:MAG: hypothetical protein ACI8RZ_000984 [Myxococcota bacterium]|jgi:hypothetical protein
MSTALKSARWLSTQAVRTHFGIGEHTLRDWVNMSDRANLDVPRIVVGRTHRWQTGAALDRWAGELSRWQASISTDGAGAFGGVSTMNELDGASAAPGSSRQSGRRRRSSGKSSKSKTSGSNGAAELRLLLR